MPSPDQDQVVEYPKDLYDGAQIENSHRDFNDRLTEARAPKVNDYVTPPVPEGIVKQRDLELQAGRERVVHFEQVERERLKISATRVPEKWEGSNTPVFRPPDVTEYKNIKGPNLSKDAIRQPPAR